MEEIRIALQSLRLSGMAEKWGSLFETRQIDRLTLADGLQLLLQAERDTRNCNKVNRLLKSAAFPYPALIEEVSPDPARGLDASVLQQLSTCDFVRDGHTVIITGATGTGKLSGDSPGRQGMPPGHDRGILQYATAAGAP